MGEAWVRPTAALEEQEMLEEPKTPGHTEKCCWKKKGICEAGRKEGTHRVPQPDPSSTRTTRAERRSTQSGLWWNQGS